ncbi:hypothetical protein RXV95_00520 [Novosphingobium sp. ZN18A2]|uniref:hypothetical protein n=1 Tax=Novosphingobium sp. ZN18A2 TaxID=3079861 RepID=UPI0030D00A9F
MNRRGSKPGTANPVPDGAWFAPKRFGMGAGLPIAWQGWAMMALHVAAILGAARLLHGHQPAQAIAIVLVGLAPLPLYAAKTRGGWRWRWGRRD